MKKPETHNKNYVSRDHVVALSDLWRDGLLFAFEFIRYHKISGDSKSGSNIMSRETDSEHTKMPLPANGLTEASSPSRRELLESSPLSEFNSYGDTQIQESAQIHGVQRFKNCHWVPIGWDRISELVHAVKTVQIDAGWVSQQLELMVDDDKLTVADIAAPYWESPAGPIWWCHVVAGHPFVEEWLSKAHQWLHPAISLALRDQSLLISERMKRLMYEVPVRVAGGLLFELLGQSAGDPSSNEDDIPIVLRSWQAHNFLITVLHIKGNVSSLNAMGMTEVQELLSAGGSYAPRTVHEVIAHLACRLARWDDRLFRKSIFGAADEIELKFMNRRNLEETNLFSIILNQEIRKLSRQVIRVKWSLHAREEIAFELLQHLRGNSSRTLLEGIRMSTREMIEEQEAVRARLFNIQDVMQSTVRAWLQDRSLRVTHNLAVFGGCGLVLSTITGLFGVNFDGIPGVENAPYAFGLFSAMLFFIGIVLIAVGAFCLGFEKPITEEQLEARKLELQQLVKKFEDEAKTHARVHKNISLNNLPLNSGDTLPDDAEYVFIQ